MRIRAVLDDITCARCAAKDGQPVKRGELDAAAKALRQECENEAVGVPCRCVIEMEPVLST